MLQIVWEEETQRATFQDVNEEMTKIATNCQIVNFWFGYKGYGLNTISRLWDKITYINIVITTKYVYILTISNSNYSTVNNMFNYSE